jgi:hypothetical protein
MIKETVHDHNLTEEEKRILGFDDDKGEYLRWMSEDGALADLFRLYVHRGDLAKAKEYFKSISDREYKFQILQMLIGDIFHSEEELERARRLSEAFEDAF